MVQTSTSEQKEWAKTGDLGKSRIISTDKLKVDLSYQRGECSMRGTAEMAQNLNLPAFGSLVVMERANGDLYVADGHQRLCVARKCGMSEVPCRVYSSEGRKHEALVFLLTNTHRIPVKAWQKFRAAIKAKNEPEVSIHKWLVTQNLEITPSGRVRNGIDFPGTVLRTWKWNEVACRNAIITQIALLGPQESLKSEIHKGLWWLFNYDVNVTPFVDKLLRLGGQSAMERSLKALAIEMNLHVSEKVAGLGILHLINLKRQHKVRPRDRMARSDAPVVPTTM